MRIKYLINAIDSQRGAFVSIVWMQNDRTNTE